MKHLWVVLALLAAAPAGAQQSALIGLREGAGMFQADFGAAFDGSFKRATPTLDVNAAPAVVKGPQALAKARLARSLDDNTLPEKDPPRAGAGAESEEEPTVESCRGFFSCMGKALISPFITPVLVAKASAVLSYGFIAQYRTPVFPVIAAGLGAILGFAAGVPLGLVGMGIGIYKAFSGPSE